jgi:ketosteroid isomerase-like protein
MQDPPAADAVATSLRDSVRAWVAAWGAEVASVDMATARRRFDPEVVAFGTFAGVVHGIDALEDEQWRNIWPTIDGFAFRLDELVVLASADGCQAVAVVPWDSEGRGPDGCVYDRPGRATVVLRRQSTDAPWFGVHTHFSLVPPPPG